MCAILDSAYNQVFKAVNKTAYEALCEVVIKDWVWMVEWKYREGSEKKKGMYNKWLTTKNVADRYEYSRLNKEVKRVKIKQKKYVEKSIQDPKKCGKWWNKQ